MKKMKRLRNIIARTGDPTAWTASLTRGGHVRFVHKAGGVVHAAATPSDQRSDLNTLANLRQVERRAYILPPR